VVVTLGDILGAAKRSTAEFERWARTSEPELAEELRRAAIASGQTPADFMRSVVAEFSRFANDEDWAQLTRIIRDDANPGIACLGAMMSWRLSGERCPDHDFQHSRE
jgi:hypothetical protein